MKYYLQIFIEKALTIYYKSDEEGIINYNKTTKSLAGHMWFRIFIENKGNNVINESIVDAGYTSKGIVKNDAESYAGEPKCQSQKLPITKEAYEKLKVFARSSNQKNAQTKQESKENPYAKSLGFGINDYNFMSNSCIDYVWKALEIAGYNEKQFQGKLLPMQNCTIIEKVEPKTDNQSIIFDRFDFNHNVDSLFKTNSCFLFDFNLIQDSKQPLESHTTDSTPTQSNTTPTTKSPKATKESTDSKTLTPNNNLGY